jgi:hypothetical protein
MVNCTVTHVFNVNYEFAIIFQLCTIVPILMNKHYNFDIKVGAMIQRLGQSKPTIVKSWKIGAHIQLSQMTNFPSKN